MNTVIENQNTEGTIVAPSKERLIAEIMYLATVVNFETNRCVFLDMSGHVDTLRISVRESKEVYQVELATIEISLKPMNFIKENPEELAKWHDKLIERLTTTRDVLKEYLNEYAQVTKDKQYEKYQVILERTTQAGA